MSRYLVFLRPPAPLEEDSPSPTWQTASVYKTDKYDCKSAVGSSPSESPSERDELETTRQLESMSLSSQTTAFDDTTNDEDSDLFDAAAATLQMSEAPVALKTNPPTQMLQNQITRTDTMYSEYSSLGTFPTFHLNMRSLDTLSSLEKKAHIDEFKSVQTSVLVAILEVEGPDYVISKRRPTAGQRIARLLLTVGDEGNAMCVLTAWGGTAETWSIADESSPKKGDIVAIENATAQIKDGSELVLIGSSNLATSLTICYRTLPSPTDNIRYRPDLRLGQSDAAVQRVSSLVAWYMNLIG